MVVASTLLSSCILLEPSPLFSSSEHWYDEIDEIDAFVDVDEDDEILESKITIEFFPVFRNETPKLRFCNFDEQLLIA